MAPPADAAPSEQAGKRSPLVVVNLGAVAAALADIGASAVEAHIIPTLVSREQMRKFERRLRQHGRKLAMARARIAELEAIAAGDC